MLSLAHLIAATLCASYVTASLSSLIPDTQLNPTISSVTNFEPILEDDYTQLPQPDSADKRKKRRRGKLAIATSGVLTFGGIVLFSRKRIESLLERNASSTTEAVQDNSDETLPAYESWLFAFIITLVLLVLICAVTFFWPKDLHDADDAEFSSYKTPTSPSHQNRPVSRIKLVSSDKSKSSSKSSRALKEAYLQQQKKMANQEENQGQPKAPSPPPLFVLPRASSLLQAISN